MKLQKLSAFLIGLLLSATPIFAQEIDPQGPGYPESCTSIIVGKKASTDGSTMTSHSCDGNYRTWLNIAPRRTFDAQHRDSIIWGLLHTEEPDDMRKTTLKGTIPSVPNTYAYLNVGYPCMNEKQLAIGETTITGRRDLVNKEGLFLVEELERIALQRCTTARQAIKLIGELVAEYGYGDGGECLTLIDPKEAWMLEITGSGPGKPAALWVAQRIPDDQVGVSANIPRISDVDFNNPEYFMYSKDLRERAKALGYWDGKGPFKFYKVINGDGKPFQIREYFVLSTLAPSLGLKFDAPELPFSVKPEKLVSPQQVISYFRETYENTEWDMTKNLWVTQKTRDKDGNTVEKKVKSPIVNNWMNNDVRSLVNEFAPGTIDRNRTIAIAGCSYSHVIQCRDWLPEEVGAVAYFSFDNPGQSPRMPIFSGTMTLPTSFAICGQKRYRPDAGIWQYREANRLSQINWTKARPLMESEVAAFEAKMFAEMPAIEAQVKALVAAGKNKEAKELVTRYTNEFAAATMTRWQELKYQYWAMFARGI